MKVKRTRATRNQMDQATIEHLKHAQGMNVPINALVSAVLFTEKVNRSLFGERAPGSELNTVLQKLIADAKVVRAEEELKAREERRRVEYEATHRIVIPGGRN